MPRRKQNEFTTKQMTHWLRDYVYDSPPREDKEQEGPRVVVEQKQSKPRRKNRVRQLRRR